MDRKKLCLPFLNLVVSRAEANKQLCNSISLLDKYLEGANLINCTNLILNCFYFPLFLRFHRWDFEHQFMLGEGKEKTSLTHDKTPEHHCLPWLMGYVFLSWPANSGCLFIIWHFFFLWKQRSECILRAFLRLICLRANLLPWEFPSSVSLSIPQTKNLWPFVTVMYSQHLYSNN